MPPRLILECTAYNPDQIPAAPLPHIALAGRSNVGKSSLINSLAEHGKPAKVSSTPGKTRSLNFYLAPAERFYLTDLPGYGYARCAKAEQTVFMRLIEHYLAKTTRLKALLLLLDCRREPQKSDLALAAFATEIDLPLLPVLTKADKCTRQERAVVGHRWTDILHKTPLLCSAVKKTGLPEIWLELRRLAGSSG